MIDDKYKNELIAKYRTDVYENDNVKPEELDELISDDDLKAIISLNNSEMVNLINVNPINKDLVRRLLIANKNFYKLAIKREMSIPGRSFLMSIATAVGYDVDKLYSELYYGAYYRAHRPR